MDPWTSGRLDFMPDLDDDASASPLAALSVLRAVATLGSALYVIALLCTLIPIVLYVVARWRDAREPTPDPQLGLKFALGLFRVIAVQGCLLGVFGLCYALTLKRGTGDLARVAMGLLLPSGIVLVTTLLVNAKTNHEQRPMVGRMLDGWNLVLCGAAAFVALLLLFQGLLQKHAAELAKIGTCLSLPYTAAVAVLLAQRVQRGRGDGALPWEPQVASAWPAAARAVLPANEANAGGGAPPAPAAPAPAEPAQAEPPSPERYAPRL
jgi:cytochrome bd-type quinol oxidase subunit 2